MSNEKNIQRVKVLKALVRVIIVISAMVVPLTLKYYGKTPATIFSLLSIIFIIIDKEIVDRDQSNANYS